MSDFKLSDALDCSPKMDSNCSDVMDKQSEKSRTNGELDLVISHNKKSMKRVGTLILHVNWMSKTRRLNNEELCSFIMDQVVDETIVERNWSASTGEKKVMYSRVDGLKLCVLTDMSQKALTVDQCGLQCKLQAINLKGGYGHLKVNFNMSRYLPLVLKDDEHFRVLLSIKDKNMHVSCSWEDNRAVLNLEECSSEKLNQIYQDTDMDRFLFIKKTTELSLNTFESVKYPGWFISTSSEADNCSVEMCQGSPDQCQRNCKFTE